MAPLHSSRHSRSPSVRPGGAAEHRAPREPPGGAAGGATCSLQNTIYSLVLGALRTWEGKALLLQKKHSAPSARPAGQRWQPPGCFSGHFPFPGCLLQQSRGCLGPRGLFQVGEPQRRQVLRGCPSRACIAPLPEGHPQRGQSPLAVTPWGAGDRGSAMATSLQPQSCHHRLRLSLLPLQACI